MKDKLKRIISKFGSITSFPTLWKSQVNGKPSRLIICQMGKVGSRSIEDSLISLKLGVNVDHVHYLNSIDAIEESIKQSWFYSQEQMYHLQSCRKVRKDIDMFFEKYHWHVITLVRDSISRTLSSYFFNLDMIDQTFLDDYKHRKDKIEDLITTFRKKIPKIPDQSHWFDHHISDVFNIDIFDLSKPKESPYFIYHNDNTSVMLLKLERLSECAEQAFDDFLGLKKFKLLKSNTSADRKYHDIYKEFTDTISFSQEELQDIYNYRLMSGFYSTKELDRFIKRWSN